VSLRDAIAGTATIIDRMTGQMEVEVERAVHQLIPKRFTAGNQRFGIRQSKGKKPGEITLVDSGTLRDLVRRGAKVRRIGYQMVVTWRGLPIYARHLIDRGQDWTALTPDEILIMIRRMTAKTPKYR
jgi:hypothetical protein